MLHNLLIIHASGTVLYSKEFIPIQGGGKSQNSMIGNLITALLQHCQSCTSLPATYVELSTVAISIAIASSHNKVMCVLFHDKEDGQCFGKMVAVEIVRVFVDEFSFVLDGPISNTTQFLSFYTKIAAAIRATIRPILTEVSDIRGVKMSAVTLDNNLLYSTTSIDQLSLVANLQAFIGYAVDLLGAFNDRLIEGTLIGNKRVIVYQVNHNINIIVVMDKAVRIGAISEAIDKALRLTAKVFSLLNNLHGDRSIGGWNTIRFA